MSSFEINVSIFSFQESINYLIIVDVRLQYTGACSKLCQMANFVWRDIKTLEVTLGNSILWE